MRKFYLERFIMDYSIEARCSVLDEGIHVLLVGGCRTHIGAVSYAFPGEQVKTIEFPTHRDSVVSMEWADQLCRHFKIPVVVNCGIHYDHVNRDDICRIVTETRKMLAQLKQTLNGFYTAKQSDEQ